MMALVMKVACEEIFQLFMVSLKKQLLAGGYVTTGKVKTCLNPQTQE
jgi:hypothetical protein